MAAPSTVTVFNILRDSTGAGLANLQVHLVLDYSQATVTATGDAVLDLQQTTITDSTGKYTFTVVPNDLLSPTNTTYMVVEPQRTYQIAPQSGNGATQQTTAANVIVNQPGTVAAATQNVTGPLTVAGALIAQSTLAVTGAVTASSTLNVSGAITAGTGIVVNSGLATTATSFPSGFISRTSTSGVGTVVKALGDGTSGLLDWTIDDTTGYLFHLHTGPNAGGSAACIGIGVDFNAQGLVVNNKASGNGIYLQQSNTVTGATSYGFYGRQFDANAPLIHLDQNNNTDAPLISMWGNASATARIMEWFGDAGTTLGGYIKGDGTLQMNTGIQFVGAFTNPSNATATVYNQSGVGPTINGNQIQFRTGGTPAARLTIDASGNSTFSGTVILGLSPGLNFSYAATANGSGAAPTLPANTPTGATGGAGKWVQVQLQGTTGYVLVWQ